MQRFDLTSAATIDQTIVVQPTGVRRVLNHISDIYLGNKPVLVTCGFPEKNEESDEQDLINSQSKMDYINEVLKGYLLMCVIF